VPAKLLGQGGCLHETLCIAGGDQQVPHAGEPVVREAGCRGVQANAVRALRVHAARGPADDVRVGRGIDGVVDVSGGSA